MSGGGMRCVYGVGVLTALVEEYGFTEPDIIVAASGSVANAAYYLAGQYRSVILAWLAILGGTRFISYKRKKIMDIDYLVDDVFKKQNPFDFKALARSKTKFFLATTRVIDGKTVYMKLPKTKAIYERMRAAKAVPVIYGKEVRIGKTNYIDGDFGASTADLVEKAAKEGAAKIIVVENHPGLEESKTRRFVLKGLYYQEKFLRKKGLQNAMLREMRKTETKSTAGVETALLAPSKPLPLKSLTRKKITLREGFNLGYADAVRSKELRTLLS